MSLTFTRPEKSEEMSALVYAIREAAISPARNGDLNLAEVINGFGQALASILAGAYETKNREVVLMALPDLVRAYFPQWDEIYAAEARRPPPQAQREEG